ncbi:MAG: TIGR00297 family protein [Methanobrevibacter sp. CfCl-M3]
MTNWIFTLILVLAGIITYHKKSLDLLGSIFMIFIGIIILLKAGISWLILILVFLILSLYASKYAKDYKQKLGIYEKKRTAKNVISNGLIAFMMAAFGGIAFNGHYIPLFGGFIGAVATATADTLASEVGVLQKPRLLTTFKTVEPGTNGAVSILGTSVGTIGAGIIGFSSFILGLVPNPILAVEIAVISGTFGCFMDSVLGAILERKGLINNEHVNLLGTLSGAIVGIILIS